MRIGVVGAGTMGMGIAQAFSAREDYRVTVCDTQLALAQKGLEKMRAKLQRAVERGKLTGEQADGMLARVSPGQKEDLHDCELIVEAVLERMDVKRALFAELSAICIKDCIFATNTSSLSITEMGLGLEQAVVGMHFFNPAEVMKLVEVVAGVNTPPAALETVKRVAAAMGKSPVVVQEAPGFVVNRILIPMINEAVGLLSEGVATAEEIDIAMTLGANHPMGPLALADLIGLDICLSIMEVLQAETGDGKYRPHPLLRKMVRGGRLGRKTGQGFFPYRS